MYHKDKIRVLDMFTGDIYYFHTVDEAHDFIDEKGNNMVIVEEDMRIW